MNQCHKTRQLLAVIVDAAQGTGLSGVILPEGVTSHISSCTECAAFWKAECRVDDSVEALFRDKPALPDGFHSNFMQRLQEEARHVDVPPRRTVTRYTAAGMAAIAAAVVIWMSIRTEERHRVDVKKPTAKLTVPSVLLDPTSAIWGKLPDPKEAIPGVDLGESMVRNLSAAVRAVTPSKKGGQS
jgi:hypothetical protein